MTYALGADFCRFPRLKEAFIKPFKKVCRITDYLTFECLVTLPGLFFRYEIKRLGGNQKLEKFTMENTLDY